MYVKTLVAFHDNERDVDRKVGEEFVVSKERFEAINAVGESRIGKPLVEEVDRPQQPSDKQTPEARAKKATGRRAAAKKKAEE